MTTETKKPDLTKLNKRAFASASYGSLSDFGETISINQDIRGGHETIRRRARNLILNSGYGAGIVTTLKNNIVGARGVQITVQGKDANGALDSVGNARIESEWLDWCSYGNCTVSEDQDWVKLQELVLQTVAVDGEAILLIRRGDQFSKHQFQLQLIVCDQLDSNFFATSEFGNRIVQGVEKNDFGKTVAFWIWQHNPNDMQFNTGHSNQRLRIPANECLHIFDPDAPGQIRGVSWFAPALVNLHHVNLLQETVLQQERLATLKQCVYTIKAGEEYQVDDELLDSASMLNKTLTPGQVEILPPGMDVQTLDWSSNSANGLGDLTKVILRSVAAAVGVSYEAISGDLSSTSYSSARFGDQMSRVKTQAKQRWFINTFIDRVYKAWLETQLLTGQIPYPFEKYSKFASPKWTPRSFASVDPIKDGNANSLSLLLGVKSRSDICAESGSDYTEVLHAQIAEEKMRIEAYAAAGIELPPNLPQLIPISVAEEQAETKKQEAGEE